MNIHFADTSALAKRYLSEAGSAWVLSWILPGSGKLTVISELAIVEMFSLLARRAREGDISDSQRDTLQAQFILHTQDEYVITALDEHVVTESRHLLNAYSLRALDSIQLASAIRA